MEVWEDEVVFTIKCENVTAVVDGTRCQVAGHVVLKRYDPYGKMRTVVDTYIRHEEVLDYMTTYSGITREIARTGMDLSTVTAFIAAAVRGYTLVTFDGRSVFSALRVQSFDVARHVELQEYFCRPDKTPYGLGPLLLALGYNFQPHRSSCAMLASFMMNLYFNDYRRTPTFEPRRPVLSAKEYARLLH